MRSEYAQNGAESQSRAAAIRGIVLLTQLQKDDGSLPKEPLRRLALHVARQSLAPYRAEFLDVLAECDLDSVDRNVTALFQTLPGTSFVVNGAAQAHDSALTTASAEMKWRNGISLAGTFEGQFSDVTNSYAGKGVVRYSW